MPKLSNVSSRYGAPMGRPEHHATQDIEVRFTLQRVRLNSGGYDCGGAYWGLGKPLYWYASGLEDVDGYLRAASREEAKAEIRHRYPKATFYR